MTIAVTDAVSFSIARCDASMHANAMAERIIIGLSGGVDSALAAALLQERGFDVVAVYLKIVVDGGACPWRDEIALCRRIAAQLDIPLVVHDVSKAYEHEVLNPMVAAYEQGSTPNPDSACNRWVKFPVLAEIASEHGASYIATGHYARIGDDDSLYRALDHDKDQTYFLWELRRKQLRSILFPIGELQKTDVREEARQRGLPCWDRPSTRGICFLGGVALTSYLERHLTPRAAEVVTTSGEHLGTVPFAQAITIGQRIPLGGLPCARYVTKRDLARGIIEVSDKPSDTARLCSRVRATATNWLATTPDGALSCAARIRHGQQPELCRIHQRGVGVVDVYFETPQVGVAAGQSIVFSDGERVLGGAILSDMELD
ncbi:MAG: tRNA 2-thiouridine(34) synthase MnmA [Candidatus Uhrbacteria bacterium]